MKNNNMKKAFYGLSIAFIAAIALAGCGSNSPKPVAEKFLNSFWHMEYKEAKTVADSATIQMIEMLEMMSTNVPDSDRQNAKKINITIKEEKMINDTTAIVSYMVSDAKEEKTLRLLKKNDKWLVNFTKNDNTETEPEQAPGADSTIVTPEADTTTK